jgi:sulfite reductase beta subunit-like hemoprotein
MSPEQRAREFIEQHGVGVDRYTVGFHVGQDGTEVTRLLAELIRAAVSEYRETVCRLVDEARLEPGEDFGDCKGRLVAAIRS